MKVAFATTWDNPCGIAGYSRSLISSLPKEIEVDVISLDCATASDAVPLAERMNQADVIHIQHQYPFFGGMAFNRNWFGRLVQLIRRPLFVTIHELDLGESDSTAIRLYKRWFNRRLFGSKRISGIIVHSDEYRALITGLGIPVKHIHIVPEGVPSVRLPEVSSDEAKTALGLSGKEVITNFGFVVKRKGYEVALEALSSLPEDVVLLIAGGAHPGDSTGYLDELKARIARSGMSERVHITDFLPSEEIPIVMAASDLVLAPFTSISNSDSILHAIAYEKPIIASDLPWTREVNNRLKCLSLVKVGDSVELADRIRFLLENEEERKRLSQAARAYSEMRSVSVSASETATLYREVLSL